MILEKWAEGFDKISANNNIDSAELIKFGDEFEKSGLNIPGAGIGKILLDLARKVANKPMLLAPTAAGVGFASNDAIANLIGRLTAGNTADDAQAAAQAAAQAVIPPDPKTNDMLGSALLGALAGGIGGGRYEIASDKEEEDRHVGRSAGIGALGGGVIGAVTPSLYAMLSGTKTAQYRDASVSESRAKKIIKLILADIKQRKLGKPTGRNAIFKTPSGYDVDVDVGDKDETAQYNVNDKLVPNFYDLHVL